MKKALLKAVVVMGLAWVAVGPAWAQFGLPVAESFEARETGIMDLAGGAMVGKDMQCYAVRDTFCAMDDLRFFVDLGLMNFNEGGETFAAQGGAVYCLPIDVPVDLGLRLSAYGANSDYRDYLGGTMMFLASQEVYFEGLYLYGGLGVDYRQTKTDLSEVADPSIDPSTIPESYTDDKFYATGTAGALMPVTEHLAVFLEFTYDKDPFVGIGLRSH